MMDKTQQLAKLKAQFANCTACTLGTAGRRTVVFGEGNPDAKLMLIGEAPGRDEDLQGRPFVGRSGQLLNQTLAKFGIKREDIYITNIVKCRPPGNRNPLPQEILTCKNLLLFTQIKIIKPQLICTLGACALYTIMQPNHPRHTITNLHGKIFTKNNVKFIPLFHPAYILRNQTKLPDFIADFALISQLLSQI